MKTGFFSSRAVRSLFTLTLLCLAVFLFYGRILTGEMLFAGDSLSIQMPEKFFIRESLLSGNMLWLNPYILCGEPLLPNIDSGLLNPLNLLLLVGHPLLGYGLFVFVHYLLAAFSMYFFVRRGMLCYRSVALCGALGYSCGGYLWSMSSNGFYRCAWLIPLFFLFLLKLYRAKDYSMRIKFFVLNTFSLALLFLCGNFYEAYFALCVACGAFLFTIPRTVKEKGWTSASLRTSVLVLIIALAVMLAFPQLLAAYNASGLSARAGGISSEEASLWSFPPLRLIEYISPFFYGANQENGLMSSLLYDVPSEFRWLNYGGWPWTDAVYIGMPLMLFFLPALLCVKRGKWHFFLLAAFLFSLLIALGRFSPVFEIFRYILPGFSMFRHPEKFIFWVNFFLLILSCAGMQAVLRNTGKARRIFLLSCGILTGICTAGALMLAAFYFMAGDSYLRLVGRWTAWDGFAMFRWQIFSLVFPGGIALAAWLSFLRRRGIFGWILAGLLFLQAFVYSLIILWTVPASCFKDVRPWTDNIPVFDRNQWRILPTVRFEFPILAPDAGEETRKVLKDPYVSNLFAVVSSLKYNTPVYFQVRSVSGFSPLAAREYIEFIDFTRRKPEYVADVVSVGYILVAGKPERFPPGDRLESVLLDGRYSVLHNTNVRSRIEAVASAGQEGSYQVILNPGNGSIRTTGPCRLVLRDRFLNGWTCVNSKGEKKEIKPFEQIFMSVDCLAPGGETLYFSYSPPEMRFGKYSFAVLSFLVFMFVYYCCPRRKVKAFDRPTA